MIISDIVDWFNNLGLLPPPVVMVVVVVVVNRLLWSIFFGFFFRRRSAITGDDSHRGEGKVEREVSQKRPPSRPVMRGIDDNIVVGRFGENLRLPPRGPQAHNYLNLEVLYLYAAKEEGQSTTDYLKRFGR